MNSKDTVMDKKIRDEFFKETGWVNDSVNEKFLDELCERQAEISFNAGMKEATKKSSKIYE
jgi:hypothetical protein